MKAVVFDTHGALDVMQYRSVPDPVAGPHECIVRVQAVALNGFDPMILRGIPGLKTPLPMTPGADIAGEIVALGAEVDRAKWKIGDRVTGRPNQQEGMVGETLRGGASEYFVTGERYLLPLPDDVSFVDAACLRVAYGAALRMMETRGQLRPGEKVLISAAGGVGVCCVQLAKSAGCEVVACAGSADRANRLKDIGADHVIDTSTQNDVTEIHRLYGKPRTRGGGGVDVIVNYTGGDTWAECFRALTLNGHLLTSRDRRVRPKDRIRYIWS